MAPTPGWIVQLTGDDLDLSYWERSLKPPFDPSCGRIPRDGGFVWALRSRSFDQMETANEVRTRALTLIAQVNGALGVQGDADPLNFQAVGRIDNEGQISFTVFAGLNERVRAVDTATAEVQEGRDTITATAEVRNANGNLVPPSPPEPSAAQKWIKAAEENDGIADMLVFAGRADNWFDIYKAIELAERLSGGEHKLPKLLGDSRAECQNMRKTANFYRHARTHRPKVLTNLTEAKPLLSFIVRTVLARLVG